MTSELIEERMLLDQAHRVQHEIGRRCLAPQELQRSLIVDTAQHLVDWLERYAGAVEVATWRNVGPNHAQQSTERLSLAVEQGQRLLELIQHDGTYAEAVRALWGARIVGGLPERVDALAATFGVQVEIATCPTCGKRGPMVYVGMQEDENGTPAIPLYNCTSCGSTVCAECEPREMEVR